MRIALAGAGGMGRVHSMAYQSLTDVKLCAVADICIQNAEGIAKVHNAAAYDNVDEMLEREKPDILDICVPTYLHKEIAIKALERKIHVLCEKPISVDAGSAEIMVDKARENNVLFMVAQVIRFWLEYKYLKKVYDDKSMGALKQISFSRLGAIPKWSWENWMLDPDKSGGAPIDLHIHDTDFIYYLLGRPKEVNSFSLKKDNLINYITTSYKYDDILVSAEGGWCDANVPFTMTFRAVFEEGVLDFMNDRLIQYHGWDKPVVIEKEDKYEIDAGININSIAGYYNEIKYFINCVRNGINPDIVTPEGTLDCLDIVFKEIESSKSGKRVTL